jgi:hypothetical protein
MEQGQTLSRLPGERFELALDSQRGMLTDPSPGGNVMTITSHRAIRHSTEGGRRTTGVLGLDRLSGMEIIDVGRPSKRLGQGLLSIGGGVLLGALAWAMFSETLFVLILGGLPALVGVYLLSGYIFPDETGELVLYAGAYTMRLPLLTMDARRDAYLAVDRISELLAHAPAVRGEAAQDDAPGPSDSDVAPSVSEVPYASMYAPPEEETPTAREGDGMTAEPAPAQETSELSVATADEDVQPAGDGPAYDGQDAKSGDPLRPN